MVSQLDKVRGGFSIIRGESRSPRVSHHRRLKLSRFYILRNYFYILMLFVDIVVLLRKDISESGNYRNGYPGMMTEFSWTMMEPGNYRNGYPSMTTGFSTYVVSLLKIPFYSMNRAYFFLRFIFVRRFVFD